MNCEQTVPTFQTMLNCPTCSRGLQPIHNFQTTLYSPYLEDSCLMCRLSKENKAITITEKPFFNPTFNFLPYQEIKEVPVIAKRIKVIFEKQTTVIKGISKGFNLPANCSIKPEDIPEFCAYNKKGPTGCFRVGQKHPKHRVNKNSWVSSMRQSVSIEEKFQQMMEYLKN